MGDVVGHKEYSSEGKIDPAGIDMNQFRIDVQAIIDRVYGGADMNDDQNNALSAVWNQVGVPHKVRKVFQRIHYNVKEGEMWTRAGLADVWNEVVWDGYVNPVDLHDGKIDPDNAPANTPVENLARRGSLISYVLGTYREATLARRAAQEIAELLKDATK
ncbi:hypothetical protein [Rhodococcoides kyotonense]|uniref:Uncharacterized protein n=1 Tax=Rhodococcoides kyotonense TaxID=398843 RepID=A0A239FNM8_9NOCA|nr:hypothetical protein [Rhodococcus kyotonensis]SNS57842.1 hypothetical protein SAMN05421642_103362 [Rhodococcus kyotonensis]